jgi:leucyl-tRNA synthetase
MPKDYDHQKIEQKWRAIWEESGIYEPDLKSAKKPYYNLMMFPYPSAEGLHIGHAFTFPGADVYGRFKRMQGEDVFEPIGLDGFGIHSENYALKVGRHPMELAEETEKRFYDQLKSLGNSFAWKERVETYNPEYYRWTQWLFVTLFKNGLVEKRKAPVNWCPKDLTVLADEQVVGGKCERCGSIVERRELEQWFFKITKYADRLLENLESLDWDPIVKRAQRNWIGKSDGANVRFQIKNSGKEIEVFTTRPDTLFGATFMVLSPNYPGILELASASQKKAVQQYQKEAAERELGEDNVSERAKTGVPLGIYVINPVNSEEIPVWVADYVSADYGSGAIMAVPAHDERDWEFAKKFKLPIRLVIEPLFVEKELPGKVREDQPFVEREAIMAIVKHWSQDKYLGLKWKKVAWGTWITGGVEDMTPEEAAKSEILEETGFKNPVLKKNLSRYHSQFYHPPKGVNRFAHFHDFYFELADGEQQKMAEGEEDIHEIVWLSPDEAEKFLTAEGHRYSWNELINGPEAYAGGGIYTNSEFLDGKTTDEGIVLMTKWLEKKGAGEAATTYRLRDWLISRQRYWGAPIPIIYCDKCGTLPVPEKDLPVVLPHVEEFRPTGKNESPLASDPNFYKTTCPKCGGPARRETDVSDTFLDSAWYYLRYPSAGDDKSAFNPEITKKWLPVHSYIGGREHSVLHLLYSRFITMALHDLGFLNFEEPFTRFRANGFLTMGGSKMSKSKGNVRTPDEYLQQYGADVTRLWLLFLGPFDQNNEFSERGIPGAERFLGKLHRFVSSYLTAKSSVESADSDEGILAASLEEARSEAIAKVSTDLEELRYNTAISAVMIYLSRLQDLEKEFGFAGHIEIWRPAIQTLLFLLAPLAPFITEELWHELGEEESIHISAWPKASGDIAKPDVLTIPVQINGKIRDQLIIAPGASESAVVKQAGESEGTKRHLENKEIIRTIYIPDKMLSFVVKDK